MAFQQLVAERIVLRRFRVDDLAAFVAYRNDPEVARYALTPGYSISRLQRDEPAA